MQGRRMTLVVAALCVLAGCGGFGGQDGDGVQESVTPVPVTPVPTEHAHGISEHGVDAPAVASKHRTALAETSYTMRTRIRWRDVNGTTDTETTIHEVEAGGLPFHVTAEYARPRGHDNVTGHELWSDGNRTLLRLETAPGEAEFRPLDSHRVLEYPRAGLIETLFDRLEVRRVRQTTTGATIVKGSLEGVEELRGLTQFRNERRATMSARITPAGYVDRLTIGFDATFLDRYVDVRVVIDVTDVGSTVVDEPDWVENASWNARASTPGEDRGQRRP